MPLIELDKIGYDPHFYPRVNGNPDWMTILKYTESLQSNPKHEFPDVHVVRSMTTKEPYMLLDGLHRLRSYLKAGRQRIPAIEERIPQSKWFSRSVELNAEHGRQLDTGDKAWIATRLKDEGWEMGAVARLLRMKVESLEKIVVSHCVKISAKDAESIKEGRSNRKINGERYGFLKSALSGVSSKRQQIEALQTQHSITSHDVLAVLDSMISILKAGVVDAKNEEVAERIKEIKRLIKSI